MMVSCDAPEQYATCLSSVCERSGSSRSSQPCAYVPPRHPGREGRTYVSGRCRSRTCCALEEDHSTYLASMAISRGEKTFRWWLQYESRAEDRACIFQLLPYPCRYIEGGAQPRGWCIQYGLGVQLQCTIHTRLPAGEGREAIIDGFIIGRT